MVKKKLKNVFIFGLLLLFVSGCAKSNPGEEIYDHLERAVSLELVFEEQQVPLSKVENEEYELYNEILNLANIEEIEPLAKKAKEFADSRKEMVDIEKASIEEAYEEFSLIKPIIETIEDEEQVNSANGLVNVMDSRYNTYMKLYGEYNRAIAYDLELYELIIKEDLTIDELEVQHEKVNGSYQKVNEYKDLFNQYTNEYNELKKKFYELVNLEVTYN
ncbi:hypothetical protein BKP37_12520 [Anaerobacillus alkalilacustris]|uniref:Cell-wall binding lipoprotein n=1 Tax=Anaerobacillus alkalilacustris TaxID=393763 RepID=A0A1S2LLQ5_9BACI|nr:YkyA family protein [Anaerobacillus alkalilacustris]OIJ13316.1 hypothetical protein BKP37_12520 [Anaerobacillus alkalilacustris]